MTEELILETHGLTKRYANRIAVDNLSIRVPLGVIAGFVGPNGAGKTTTLSMLLGLISPTSGTALVMGEDLSNAAAYLPHVGALIERPVFYPGLTGLENLQLLSMIGGHDRAEVEHTLDLVGLKERGNDRFGTYSLGMKQRLGIAAALIGNPALLVLDEPTNGLDPAGMHETRQLMRDLADKGKTILVSSHLLAELEQVCDWFVVIDEGSLVYQGSKSSLLDESADALVVVPADQGELPRLAALLEGAGLKVEVDNSGLRITVGAVDAGALAAEVNGLALENGVKVVELRRERANLEERYLRITAGGNQ